MQQEQDERVIKIAAAWEVWGELLHEVRRYIQTNQWNGDMTEEYQRVQLQQQLRAQCLEAYARARVQIAIAEAIDGVDQVPQFEAHWRATWGDVIAFDASTIWAEKWGPAITNQRNALERRQKQGANSVPGVPG